MFSHVTLGANDIEAARVFYDALLGALGMAPGRIDDKGRLVYLNSRGLFIVTKPIDGAAACHANGGTIGFAASSPEQVDAAHAAGIAHGGTSCEDPPGPRAGTFGPLHLGYLRDPQGNKLCLTYRGTA